MTESELMKKLEEVIAINDRLAKENAALSQMYSGGSRNVEVGCNAVYGVTLLSPNSEIEIDIKYGETVSLPAEDIQSLLKRNSTRKLFVNGIVFFVDEGEYEKFSIRRRCSINTEAVAKAFKGKTASSLKKFFDTATSNKMDMDVMNILFYKIVHMMLVGELGEINHNMRVATEEYFGMDLDMASKLYTKVKSFL